MRNIKINRKKLYDLYIKEVERISDLCEDKSRFSAEDLVGIISQVLEENIDIITEKKPRI
jgi:hypothetical protein